MRLRLGRLPARARHGARAGRLRHDRGEAEEAAARGKLRLGIGSTLDSGTNDFGQSQLFNPACSSREQRGRDGQAGHLRRGRCDPRHDPAGPGYKTTAAQVVADILGCDVDIVHVPRATTATGTRTPVSGTYASQFAVTGLGASRARPRTWRTDEDPRVDGVPVPDRGDRETRRRLRPDRRQPPRPPWRSWRSVQMPNAKQRGLTSTRRR